jgi:putative membrane protein
MTPAANPRQPEAFKLDDVALSEAPEADGAPAALESDSTGLAPPSAISTGDRLRRGIRWGGLLLAAAGALASLALSLWFARFVSVALARQDWIGWIGFALLCIVLVATLAIALREVAGFFRLVRLGRLKRDAAAALRENDLSQERAAVRRITAVLSTRPELRWSLARLRDYERHVRDAGDLARLADRELLAPLDAEARRVVAGAVKRVSVATAISPAAVFAVGWVLVENLRLLRALAGIYGGRPGWIGTARLGRMVLTHIIATGGLALTDDLLGQFLGQDLVRRLSRRLGEGIFNGALTARIGAAAIEVIRPLPFLEARPVRARDFLRELTRRSAEPGREPAAGSARASSK